MDQPSDVGVDVMSTHVVEGVRVHMASGSVVDFAGDCIVNAANEGCLSGGGVDGAVSAAGGRALYEDRLALPILDAARAVRCRTGDAKMTLAHGRLRCRWVIHAVGPNYHVLRESAHGDSSLCRAYAQSMVLACATPGLRTLAFALLSSGVFRGARPLRDVLEMGVCSVRDAVHALRARDVDGTGDLSDVYLVGFTPAERRELQSIAESQLPADESAPPPLQEPRRGAPVGHRRGIGGDSAPAQPLRGAQGMHEQEFVHQQPELAAVAQLTPPAAALAPARHEAVGAPAALLGGPSGAQIGRGAADGGMPPGCAASEAEPADTAMAGPAGNQQLAVASSNNDMVVTT